MHPTPLLAALALPVAVVSAQVEVVETDGQFELRRGGSPYFIKGVGGDGSLEEFARAGGNSIRLWGVGGLGEKLDAAQELGLTVTAGIWLGQVRQGFDWSNAESLIKQREHVRAAVEKFKDHPALLIWCLGNEMEDPEGGNGAVWSEIDSLAAMVKASDPGHPVMTVVAEIGGQKVPNLHKLCPHIDIVGINSYAGAASLGKRYRELGGSKPYILTEFGPPGIWEIGKDEIGAYPELTSTEKGEAYRRSYAGAVSGNPDFCLGSYAFLWGGKQEVTATWFSMLLPDGTQLAAAQTMGELWSGKKSANACPRIESLAIPGSRVGKPGEVLIATLSAGDPEGDALDVTWVLQQDPAQYGTGGDAEAVPPTFPEAIVESSPISAKVKLPAGGGFYRLFAYVRDGKGGGAVANVPLKVDAPVDVPSGAPAELPLVVFDEADTPQRYIPAGWMGDTKSIRVEPAHRDNPKQGEICMRCDFTSGEGWGGVVWQSPANDWGDRAGGYDLSGAKTLSFWARGEKGGETLSCSFGIIGADKPFHDTATGALEKITLTTEWQEFKIPVAGKDLSRIKSAFSWSIAGSGAPSTFYLDAIRWE